MTVKATNSAKMNPQIATVEIGIKTLRSVLIYPLSVSDQLNLTNIITGVIQEIASVGDSKDDMETVNIAIDAIKINLAKILVFVLDKGEEISFDELSNAQLVEVVDIIFEANYEDQIKNLKRLVEKARILWSSAPSSPKSSEKPATS